VIVAVCSSLNWLLNLLGSILYSDCIVVLESPILLAKNGEMFVQFLKYFKSLCFRYTHYVIFKVFKIYPELEKSDKWCISVLEIFKT